MLVVMEALLAVGAYGGAVGLVTGGVDLGAATADLPFGSAVFGGVALAVVNGLLPTVVVVGALLRRPWASAGHLLVGIALAGWIVFQVALIGLGSWLQVAYFGYGLVIVFLSLALMKQRSPAHAHEGLVKPHSTTGRR